MDVHASLQAPCEPAALFAFVDDLARYPDWVDLVHRAEADDDGDGGDGGRPAWAVELRARLGPLARSKRLRMERTVHDTERHVAVFERVERDGRHHSPWVLRAEVVGDGEGSALHMHLHYGGALWTGGLMERALTDQITAGRERLSALVSA
ncbi:MAG: SRPBCC family protein [Ilumatobacter sp.]|nr:SRPBCC family protein [Ilumatobacter sp.]MCB0981880.1 SRPBCC family protein [Ilumatobacter sp.]MCB0985589.1 SRPBCC family protein [Ilumatobacter sp.]MCB9381307.1 SRPBCC family protein [Acidimicrobiaceae bacterium]MCO5332216.1 SRPBCC family protein [Ilumatobacteraceae bacterium]